MKSMVRALVWSCLTLVLVISPGRLPELAAQDYDKDVPYQQAVPAFWEDVTNLVEDDLSPEELAAVEQWEAETRQWIRLFLSDWIAVSRRAVTASGDQIFADYEATNQKWVQLITTFPGLDGLEPGMNDILNKLLAGLPTVRAVRPGDNPYQNYYEWMRAMEAENPWGTAAFFQLQPLAPEDRQALVTESAREWTEAGIRSLHIIRRETRVSNHQVLIYYELIEDDQLIERVVAPPYPTMVHQMLADARRDAADPQVIAVLQRYVDLIDEELLLAKDEGRLQPALYDILYNQGCPGDMDVACRLPTWLHRMVRYWNDNKSYLFFGNAFKRTGYYQRVRPSGQPSSPAALANPGGNRSDEVKIHSAPQAAQRVFDRSMMPIFLSSFLLFGLDLIRHLL